MKFHGLTSLVLLVAISLAAASCSDDTIKKFEFSEPAEGEERDPGPLDLDEDLPELDEDEPDIHPPDPDGPGPNDPEPGVCGDGILQDGEECDGEVPGPMPCPSGFEGEITSCTATCSFDLSGCVALEMYVTSGTDHACMYRPGQQARCWGENARGQLGDGTRDSREVPDVVPALTNVAIVSPGNWHSCAMDTDARVWCWGSGASGQLGDGGPMGSLRIETAPVEVTGLTDTQYIQAGSAHTCALDSAGDVRCWGDNSYSQITFQEGSSCPLCPANTPQLIEGLSDVVTFSAGGAYTCALEATGQIKCWGHNGSFGHRGIIGADDSIEQTHIPQLIDGITDAVDLDAGVSHTCAIVRDGEVMCWGHTRHGMLGAGEQLLHPVQRTPLRVAYIDDAIQISLGRTHSCALHRNGEVSCWGRNDSGQLGANIEDQNAPVKVEGIEGAVSIASGRNYSCAAFPDGEVRCWGQWKEGFWSFQY